MVGKTHFKFYLKTIDDRQKMSKDIAHKHRGWLRIDAMVNNLSQITKLATGDPPPPKKKHAGIVQWFIHHCSDNLVKTGSRRLAWFGRTLGMGMGQFDSPPIDSY